MITYSLKYPDYNSIEYYAGIYTDQLNNAGQPLRTIWVGHSFMAIRDTALGTAARNEFLKRAYEFFENGVAVDYTGTEVPKAYSLAQNFPNPFNPLTTIRFGLREGGRVSLQVYYVSGRLVSVLADETRAAGIYTVEWDGLGDDGRMAASGVYFYCMVTADLTETRKMVLLR